MKRLLFLLFAFFLMIESFSQSYERVLVIPPANLITTTMTAKIETQDFYGNINTEERNVIVGYSNNSLFIQGLFPDYPSEWIVGSISEQKDYITFSQGQYLGLFFGMLDLYVSGCAKDDTGQRCDFILERDVVTGVMNNNKDQCLATFYYDDYSTSANKYTPEWRCRKLSIVPTEAWPLEAPISAYNTIETAYSIDDCISIIDDEQLQNEFVYIKGIVAGPYRGKIVDTRSGTASFYISDDGDQADKKMVIYQGYDYGGKAYTEEKLKVGDEVIFLGKLVKYGDSYETAEGAELVLHNDIDASGQMLPCATPTIEYVNGQLHFNCSTPEAEIFYSICPTSIEDVKVNAATIPFAPHFTISCYAKAPNHANSNTTSITVSIPMGLAGDMNSDGVLTIGDVSKIVDCVLAK